MLFWNVVCKPLTVNAGRGIACNRLSQGIFNIVRMTKKCATRRVIINVMDNNKGKPKLVAEGYMTLPGPSVPGLG